MDTPAGIRPEEIGPPGRAIASGSDTTDAGKADRFTGSFLALAAWIPDECRRLDIESVLRLAGPEPIEEPDEQFGCAACPLVV
jgi:hypothetical protein